MSNLWASFICSLPSLTWLFISPIFPLCRHYYSIAINYRKTELEQTMLMNLHKKNWVDGLTLRYSCL
mgnify:CR=1 FL=1